MLADTNDYPLDVENDICIKHIKAKPFSIDFDEQADAATSLYGDNTRFFFTSYDMQDVLKTFEEHHPYEIISRARDLLMEQKRKYNYMFSN